MSTPAGQAAQAANPVPRSTELVQLGVSLLALVLGPLGATDDALPRLVRAEAPALTVLVLAVIAFTHHRTLQAAAGATAALAEVATTAAQTLAPPSGVLVPGTNAEAVMALVGRALDAGRDGLVAVAQYGSAGRHATVELPALPAAPVPPTAQLPALPSPAAPADVESYPPSVPAAGAPLIGA